MKTNSTKKIVLAFIKTMSVVVLAIFLVWVFLICKVFFSYSAYPKTTVLVRNTVMAGYIADSESIRTKGLSGKSYLPTGSMMIFVFPEEDTHGIWMKDMLFPIDIIWLDNNKNVVDLISEVDPSTYPHVFYPNKSAKYVVEIRSGFIKDKDIKKGEFFNFNLKP